jgi:hypothetical protein
MNIKKVTPLLPEMVSKDFDKTVRQKYKKLVELENSLFEARDVVRLKEEQLKEAKKEWDFIERMCDIEYEKEIVSDESKGDKDFNLMIINPSDRRNN